MAEQVPESDSKPTIRVCAAILLLVCVLLGGYCCELNRQYYQHHHPFYDSLSYNEKLFRVMTISKNDGIVQSMQPACFENNTNCLPFIVAAVFGKIVSPSRLVGIWIQTGLLYLFLASLLSYLVRIRGTAPSTALAGCLAFVAVKCLYFSNGGLSDFRMDLSLFLAFGMTCIWFLTSMERPTKWNFVLLGVSAAIACLFRATAPIYLIFSIAPLAAIELLRSEKRMAKAVGIISAAVIVAILAGWFFVLNFEFLKFYYVDWNTDANAKIPFFEALHHWKLTQRSVGEPLAVMIFCWIIGVLVFTGKSGSIGAWTRSAIASRDIDWRIGWLAISPVVLMVAQRAGLNPFVCMPAVFGLVLFFTLPCMKQMDRLANKTLTRFCWFILLICLVASVVRGWQRHSRVGFDTMAAQNQLIDEMVGDARSNGLGQLRFGIMHLTDLNSNSLYSTLLFNRADATPNLNSIQFDGLEVRRIATFSQPAAADWRILKGESNEEKFDFLMGDANRRMDYLILPDEATAKELETTAAHNYINRYLVPLRKRIVQDSSWVRVGESIATNEVEVVEIYRKTR